MAITTRDVGAGVGGASLGIGGSEIVRRSVESDRITDRQGAAIVAIGSGLTGGLAVADFTGMIDPPNLLGPTAGGYALGSATWYAGRSVDLFPRLVIEVPDEINLASPLVGIFTVGLVGAAATALFRITS